MSCAELRREEAAGVLGLLQCYGGRAIQWVTVLQWGASGGFPDWPPRLLPASVSCSILPR